MQSLFYPFDGEPDFRFEELIDVFVGRLLRLFWKRELFLRGYVPAATRLAVVASDGRIAVLP